MDPVEVKVLKYRFLFRPIFWREEFSIKPKGKEDRRRVILATALIEVSGLKVTKFEDAYKVFSSIPLSIVDRIFTIYKGSLPAPHVFKTIGLYKAPEPLKFSRRVEKEIRDREDDAFKRAENVLESKYSREELRETMELERAILKGSKMRGATTPTPDSSDEQLNATNRRKV